MKRSQRPEPTASRPAPPLTDGQRAYESRRAAKAGVSLDKWLAMKQRDQADRQRAEQAARTPPKPAGPAKPATGFFARLMERATRPL